MLFDIHTMLTSQLGKKQLIETLKYNFVELNLLKIKQMKNGLNSVYEQVQRISELPEADKLAAYADLNILNQDKRALDIGKLNALYLSVVLNVFQSSARAYPMSHEQFLDHKAEQLKKVITAANPSLLDERRQNKLLDIGCGDCHMTRRVAAKLNAEPTGVDLGSAEDTRMWVGEVGAPSQLDSDIVYYDGVHLTHALREKTANYSELFDVITFNHVLHHYPDRKGQIEGVQQAVALLKEGGVLLFSEHATVLDDQFFELQHVLFHLKSDLSSGIDILRTRQEMLEFCEAGLQHYEQDKHEANYFSEALLTRISESLGLKPIVSAQRTPKGTPDASSTVFTGFIKTAPALTPEQLESFQPKKPLVRSLEEGDHVLPHQKHRRLAELHDDSNIFFKSVPKASGATPEVNPEDIPKKRS